MKAVDIQVPAVTEVLQHILQCLRFIDSYRAQINEYCAFNGTNLNPPLESQLFISGSVDLRFLFNCLAVLYRFILEFDIVSGMQIDDTIRAETMHCLKECIRSFPNAQKFTGQLNYIESVIPSKILAFHFARAAMKGIDVESLSKINLVELLSLDVSKINDQINRGESFLGPMGELARQVEERERTLNAHKERIEKYTNDYNFIGLSDAFRKLRNQKWFEITLARSLALLCWAGLLFVPYKLMGLMVDPESFFSGLGFDLQAEAAKGIVEMHSWKLAIPFLTIEFILLYFLRIQLINIKACGAQMLQINLRQSLCQFIQEYVNHAQEMKGKDEKLLDRFETLIFSPIVAKETDIPASLEGISQLVEIIKPKKPAG